MTRKLALSFAALTLLASACGRTDISVTAVEPPEGGFFTQVVDFAGDTGHGLALATDADGNPHLSYIALAEEGEGPEAAPSPTPVPGPTGTPGATPSPAGAPPGQPPIVPAVAHAHFVENQLTRSAVAQARDALTAEDETAIVVDADGVHHVAWTEGGSSLWYANTAGGDFGAPAQISLVGDEVNGPSIAVAEDRTVYVSFSEGTGVEGPGAIVRVAAILDGEAVAVETAAEAGEPGSTAIGAGAQGVLVAYGSEGQTLLARDEGDFWSSEAADEDGGLAISMALDADGNPHIAYGNEGGSVKHAHSVDGADWEVTDVGTTELSADELTTGIAVDEEGIHHVAWTDGTGISYSNNAEGAFGEAEVVPGTDTDPAAESPAVGVGPEGPYIAWFDPGDTEVQLSQRAEDAPPLALPSPSPQTGAPTDGGTAVPCEPEGTDLTIAAEGSQFDKDCLAAPAGEPFTLAFDNRDALPHNVAIYTDPEASEEIFVPEQFTGPATETYDVDPIEEPGQFYFQCDVHPTTMQGSFVVDGGAEGGGGSADEGGGGQDGGGQDGGGGGNGDEGENS